LGSTGVMLRPTCSMPARRRDPRHELRSSAHRPKFDDSPNYEIVAQPELLHASITPSSKAAPPASCACAKGAACESMGAVAEQVVRQAPSSPLSRARRWSQPPMAPVVPALVIGAPSKCGASAVPPLRNTVLKKYGTVSDPCEPRSQDSPAYPLSTTARGRVAQAIFDVASGAHLVDQ
jgi:hypothetical protein